MTARVLGLLGQPISDCLKSSQRFCADVQHVMSGFVLMYNQHADSLDGQNAHQMDLFFGPLHARRM